MVGIWLPAKGDPTPHRCYGHVALQNEKASQSLHSLFKFNLGKEQSKGTLQECFWKMYGNLDEKYGAILEFPVDWEKVSNLHC